MRQNNQEKCRDTYRTGSTNPPKSHQGIITVLLILVTVLSSIVTVLGMMNIQLWSILEKQQEQEQDYSAEEQIALAEIADNLTPIGESSCILGMTCQEISELYRSYNGWPNGLYVSQVEPESTADRGGILPGDILVAVNGRAVILQDELEQAVQELSPGDQLRLTLYRDAGQIDVALTVD